MSEGFAVFTEDGMVRFFDHEGKLNTKGRVGANINPPLFDLGVALIQYHKQWPSDFPCERVVELKGKR